ncbi:MAG: class I SAM-dependent methyltransferase [Gammaproteobacteria bacterium]
MSNQTLAVDDRLYGYLIHASLREPEILKRLRDETAALPEHSMQIAPEEGQFLAFLVRLIGAKHCLEVGVFTGYSSLWVVSALPEEGTLRALDVSEPYTSVARRYWREAGIEDRIDLRLGPARKTLLRMTQNGERGSYDFAFIDADKVNYLHYYESVLDLLRPGGIVAIDNVLWGGAVADPSNHEVDTIAIRKFNEHLHQDERIDLTLIPIGDGLTVARKRA